METDENKREKFELFEEISEIDKERWEIKIREFAPETGFLSMLMLLNDIFLEPYFQTLVNKQLIKKYEDLLILSHIFKPSKI